MSKSKLRAKRGRPAKDGARYPCGKLKDDDKAYVGANVARRLGNLYRISQRYADVERAALDPRLSDDYAPGVLFLLRRVTQAELEDGEAIARIYGRYERMNGLRRSSASPSYQVGRGGSTGDDDPDAAAIRLDFQLLQEAVAPYGARGRNLIEEFWVEGRHVVAAQLEPLLQTTRAVVRKYRQLRDRNRREQVR